MSISEFCITGTYTSDGIQKAWNVAVHVHNSLESIIAAFLEGSTVSKIATLRAEYTATSADIAKMARYRGCWGWTTPTAAKAVIHCWIDRSADLVRVQQSLMELLAHEQGHIAHPHFTSSVREEQKAVSYEIAAGLANTMAQDIMLACCHPDIIEANSTQLGALLRMYADEVASATIEGSQPQFLHELTAVLAEIQRRKA